MSKAVTVDPSTIATEDERSCPNCDAALANVQGIDACVDCHWTGA